MRSWLNESWLRVIALFRRRQLDRDLEDELAFHLAMRERKNREAGMDALEAGYAARRRFGNVSVTHEKSRKIWTFGVFEEFWQDLRFGFRKLMATPGFTATAILTLALGIGANSAMFSVVDAVLLKPLPYQNPASLVTISESDSANDPSTRSAAAPGNFLDWREQNRVFGQMIGVSLPGYSLTGGDRAERVLGAALSAGALGMLGLRPQIGREFSSQDDRQGAAPVVMLSDSLWRRRFNADPNLLNKIIHLNANPYTVVGVLPRGLQFPTADADVDVWVPLEHEITAHDMLWRNTHYLDVYARLNPGVTLAQAREQMNAIAGALKKSNPDSNGGAGALVLPMQNDLVHDVRTALLILLGAVGLVLLVACANVANLLLVRAFSREKEMSVRMALGAGAWRLVRQVLAESILLSLAGGAAGLAAAGWIRQAFLALRPAGSVMNKSIHTDWRVFLFTFVVSVLTGILFGLVPALRASRSDVLVALQSASRGSTSGAGAHRLRNVLVAAEIGVSLILLVGAGLLIKSFVRLSTNDLGFRVDHAVTARISIPAAKYSQDAQVADFYDRLLEKTRSLPGVEAAGMVSYLPLTGINFNNSFDVAGRTPFPRDSHEYPLVRFVDPEYFGVMDIRLLRGRGFTNRDRLGRPRALVISEAMARRYWPNANPLGEHLVVYMGMDQSPWEIVGVVGDVRTAIGAAPEPTMYFPYPQMPYRYMVLAVRTHSDANSMMDRIRAAANSIDPDQPVYQVRTLETLIAQTLLPWRFSMSVLAAFAGLALVLAAAGVYGVVSYSVGQRTREIGIRIALGAQRRELVRLVFWKGLGVSIAGICAGACGALCLTRFLSTQLYAVRPSDPMTFAAVAFLLLAVASLATWMPARRALRVDPVVALRDE